MAERAHAILSASSSDMWLHCTPSAQLNEAAGEPVSTDFADRGTLGHALFALLLRAWLDYDGLPPDYEAATLRASKHYDKQLEEHVEEAVEAVKREYAKALALDPSARLLIEQRADYSEWVPEGKGTADVTIIFLDTLLVIDLKLGEGIVVSAIDNSQARLYALGRLRIYEGFWDVRKIQTLILQPTRDNVSWEEITVEELLAWAEEVVKPQAKLAWEGKGELKAGEWCQFCKVKDTCPERIKSALNIIEELTEGPAAETPPLLTPKEIAELVKSGKFERAVAVINSLRIFAYNLCKAGELPGFKLVEGKKMRAYTDELKVKDAVVASGVEEPLVWKPRTLLGITEMQKLLGKKGFKTILEDTKLVKEKPAAPKMVPVEDRRPALDKDALAAAKFAAYPINSENLDD